MRLGGRKRCTRAGRGEAGRGRTEASVHNPECPLCATQCLETANTHRSPTFPKRTWG